MMTVRTLVALVFSVAVGLACVASSHADVIHLKNGNYFRVGDWRDTGEAIEFTRLGGTVRVPKEDVLKIEKAPERRAPRVVTVREAPAGPAPPGSRASTRTMAATPKVFPRTPPPRPGTLAGLLKATPPSMMITYVDRSMLGLAAEMNPNPILVMQQFGVAADQFDRLVLSLDLVKAFSGEGGSFLAVQGKFTAPSVAEGVKKTGASRKEGGFTIYSQTDTRTGQEALVTVKNNLVIAGAAPDVRAGLELRRGRGPSAYQAKGVAGALQRAGEPRLAVVVIPPPGGKSEKDYALSSVVTAVSDIAPDNTADVTIVMACPTRADAEKALADFERQAAEKGKKSKITSIRADGIYVIAKAKGPFGELIR